MSDPVVEAAASGSQKPKKAEAIPMPEYVDHRLKLWEEYKGRRQAEAQLESKPIKVTVEGQVRDAESHKTRPFDIAKALGDEFTKNAIAAKVNRVKWDLFRPLVEDCALEFIFFESDEGKEIFWHSSSHILGQALEVLYGAHLCKGPPVEDGFYYDVVADKAIAQDSYDAIEKAANRIVKESQAFERLEMSKEEALEMFKHNHFKVEIIGKRVPDGSRCTAYRCGPLIDLCRGPHLPSTARVKAFAVTKNSSAYWEGDSSRESLQRIYGVSFPTKEQYKEYKELMAEAAKRDHRVVGKHQELFFFHVLSPGSCFFLPHGARLYNRLVEFIRKEYWNRGFTEVVTPNIYNIDLWKTSGHWQNYQEHMFHFEIEKQTFALKPMNCPGHCLMFDHRPRSYRELPIRMADFGVLHRNEYSGALTGLTRVRRFQQDDAHIFCAPHQITDEIQNCLKFLKSVYGIFGFTFELELSTRPDNYLGELDQWEKAEKALADALNAFGQKWKVNPGDGAFYGPKIDIKIYDALKRRHQCATIQLDFQLPIRFNLTYVPSDEEKTGEEKIYRPVIIHRAILGSVERMIAILTEHTGGKWPFWISPRQCIVVSVSEGHNEYARRVEKMIHDAGYYVDADLSDRTIAKKVREAQLAQYNYILVVGQEEITSETVNIRTRDNVVHGKVELSKLISELDSLRDSFK
eukprot:TRINITY_DN1965_c0_g1_i1.p1 TRINITY_DN1965_c0_g1~~TRINITY_DN1965_c0_g1_i1.p1  ORF type:complete len:690 (+),score=151.82 TRINITY_DN1965_c0_g1_i1:60-2129(+)